MALAIEVHPQAVDYDENYANAVVLNNATDVEVATITCKPGKRAYLAVLATVIDAGAQPFVTFKLLKNGTPMYPFASNANQWSDPALNTRLPSRIEIPQLSKLQVMCQVSAGGPASSNAAARLIVEYEDF